MGTLTTVLISKAQTRKIKKELGEYVSISKFVREAVDEKLDRESSKFENNQNGVGESSTVAPAQADSRQGGSS